MESNNPSILSLSTKWKQNLQDTGEKKFSTKINKTLYNTQNRNSLTNAAYELLDDERWNRIMGADNSYNYKRLYYEIIKKLEEEWSITYSINFPDHLIRQVGLKRKIEQSAYQRLQVISQELKIFNRRINNLIKCQIPWGVLSRMNGIDILHIYKKAHKQSKIAKKYLDKTNLLINYDKILPEINSSDIFCETDHTPVEIEAAKKYYYHHGFYNRLDWEIKKAKTTNSCTLWNNVKNFFSTK
jgi:hypothetical protein